jgi:nicotinate-nucleotide adenylyltransferase
MVALTVAGRAGWRASDLELRTPPPSYTTSTLKQFHARGYRPSELFFLIGADAFAEIESWKDYPALLGYSHFAVVSRPGHPVQSLPVQMPHLAHLMTNPAVGPETLDTPSIILIDASTADVSSTAIRERRSQGRPITGLVAVGVQQHIEQHGLYTSRHPGRRAMDQAAGPGGR